MEIVALLEAERVTPTFGVPTIAHAILNHLDAHPSHDLSALRILLVGGAAIPETTIRAFDARHGIRVLHAWGRTETAPLGSINRLPSELLDAPVDDQYAWRARQGRPAPFVEARARADDGSLVPPGRRGAGREPAEDRRRELPEERAARSPQEPLSGE